MRGFLDLLHPAVANLRQNLALFLVLEPRRADSEGDLGYLQSLGCLEIGGIRKRNGRKQLR